MLLSQLILGLEGASLIKDRDVSSVTWDSRLAVPGSLFVAISGFQADGHDFIEDALKKGAVGVVAEKNVPLPVDIGFALVQNSRVALSHISSIFFGHPDRELLVIGVTGTKGKTTVTHMIKTLLDQAGLETGLIGTVHNIVGDKVVPCTHTTPESFEIQGLLREMVDSGCRAVSMEVSSHALSLHRVDHIKFDVAAFTNIGRDHLDFHGTLEGYVAAKKKLFEMVSPEHRNIPGSIDCCPFVVLNADDNFYDEFKRASKVSTIDYGFSAKASVRAEDLTMNSTGSRFMLCYGDDKAECSIGLPGRFNVQNALCAAAVGLGLGYSCHEVASFLGKVKGVPGRAQIVNFKGDFTIWVDYSHTPESLENILSTARQTTNSRVIVVFGCGGNRDRGKRPMMGRIARRLADYAIITDDNPRQESEDAILDDIEEGLKDASEERPGFAYERIKDRRSAIERAIELARPGDLVVLAGKGHETYQIFKDRTIHFDDAEEALKAVVKLGKGEVS